MAEEQETQMEIGHVPFIDIVAATGNWAACSPVASLMLSYGALKLFPVWDPLRGDPRFEKIVQSQAPKEQTSK